jgi:hypothetical protein
MITSHSRGHKITYKRNRWVYSDTGESISKERPCIRCGKLPTLDGHDACLGYVPGVVSVCCGHGVTNKILIRRRLDGKN